MPRRAPPPSRRQHAGLTLVELMVSLAVGLVIISGLVLMFANTSQSSSELDRSARLIENGRYATDLLTDEISMAGYYDAAPVSTYTATVSPCASASALAADLDAQRNNSPPSLPVGIEGLTPGEAAALGCLAQHKSDTPALILRRLDTTAIAATATASTEVYLQTSNFNDDANQVYTAGTSSAVLTLRDRDGSVNTVRRFVTRVYYVATCSDCGQDTIPTLKRAEVVGGTVTVTPLAEGIERVAFDYGFDTDGDGSPDEWIGLNGTAGTTESAAAASRGWGNVVAVRLYVLARTNDASASSPPDGRVYASGLAGTATVALPATNDQFRRRAYVVTARAHALAGRRELP